MSYSINDIIRLLNPDTVYDRKVSREFKIDYIKNMFQGTVRRKGYAQSQKNRGWKRV